MHVFGLREEVKVLRQNKQGDHANPTQKLLNTLEESNNTWSTRCTFRLEPFPPKGRAQQPAQRPQSGRKRGRRRKKKTATPISSYSQATGIEQDQPLKCIMKTWITPMRRSEGGPDIHGNHGDESVGLLAVTFERSASQSVTCDTLGHLSRWERRLPHARTHTARAAYNTTITDETITLTETARDWQRLRLASREDWTATHTLTTIVCFFSFYFFAQLTHSAYI